MKKTKIFTNILHQYLKCLTYQPKVILNIPPKKKNWKIGNKGNILCLPGWGGSIYDFEYFANHFSKKGFQIHHLDKYNSLKNVKGLAQEVNTYILNHNLYNFTILAHSKGGLVAKYLVDRDPTVCSRTKKIVTFNTPFKGTIWGHVDLLSGRELRPSSSLIKEIISNKTNLDRFIQIYSEYDPFVIPNNSHIFPKMKLVKINVVGHVGILFSEETRKILDKIIT